MNISLLVDNTNTNMWLMIALGIPVVIFILIILYAISNARRKGERLSLMEIAAEGMGWQFTSNADYIYDSLSQAFPFFNAGEGRSFKNMFKGQAGGADVKIFEFEYRFGGGTHPTVREQTIVHFRSSKLNLPNFSLRPEGVLSKIGSTLGSQDIDFETHPEFSKSYLLRGDEQDIRKIFDNSVLAFYEKKSGVRTMGAGDQLIYFRDGARIAPQGIKDLLDEALKVFHIFETVSPKNDKMYNNIGDEYFQKRQYEKAIESFKQAARLNPDNAMAHSNIGLAYYESGKHAEAIEPLKCAISLKPDYVNAHYILGAAYHKVSEKDAALEQHKILQRLDPKRALQFHKFISG